MNRREFVLSTLSSPLLLSGWSMPAQADTRTDALAALKRSAVYMDEVVSYQGGYVWSYAPDFSRQFGEMEAYRTMCWLQPPGTSSIGHVYLDAYHATGDERFYQAARPHGARRSSRPSARTAAGITSTTSRARTRSSAGTTPSGAMAGVWRSFSTITAIPPSTTPPPRSRRSLCCACISKGTTRPSTTPRTRRIDFILEAQFGPNLGIADGGWPQRFPHNPKSISSMPMPNPSQLPANSWAGMEDGDYTLHVTFNDDVMGENIKFLTMCVMSLGKKHLVPRIIRAMDCMRRMQQPAPQAGWSLQHLSRPTNGRPAGAPAGARSYEPRSLATHTTQTNIQQLFHYFDADRRPQISGAHSGGDRLAEDLPVAGGRRARAIRCSAAAAHIRPTSSSAPMTGSTCTAMAPTSITAPITSTRT